ncbi:MAG: two-component sensor histidine kinase/CheY-like chemotaxis protein [Afipia broomeae]|jgi:two-component sensor histidine kinase/CheY-like chemotaxis protein|uniref:response regulator n=1 Tax=Treponema endosymbiont of Eucomonympha sp. TaxID=1580831 RepID=UPI000AF928E9|nr:response regulator [Treponema endosymbiont of Eucomonympha sp.]
MAAPLKHEQTQMNLPSATSGYVEEATLTDSDTTARPASTSPETSDLINILIVDDEPRNLTVLESVLDAPRYRLVRAESAEQALLSLLADEFAVLILDVRLPGLTGFELAQMIRERKKNAEIPIIFLTAYYNEDQHVIEGYDSGAVDYLHKPINPAILRSKVAVLVELYLKQRELENANRALMAEVAERRLAQQQLYELNNTLEQRVLERTEAHKRSEEQVRLLMNEVNHRSKNILSVVMAVAQQTVASNSSDFLLRFSSRIQALAVNHDLLVVGQWKCVDASDLVRGQLAHFAELIGQRITVEGPRLRLAPSAAQSVGMVVHELSTNAVKHGALSVENGRVEISWRLDGDAGSENFTMSWVEKGGPPVARPANRGFGTTVITKMTEMSLGGKVELSYASTGLIWRLSCPAKNVLEAT